MCPLIEDVAEPPTPQTQLAPSPSPVRDAGGPLVEADAVRAAIAAGVQEATQMAQQQIVELQSQLIEASRYRARLPSIDDANEIEPAPPSAPPAHMQPLPTPVPNSALAQLREPRTRTRSDTSSRRKDKDMTPAEQVARGQAAVNLGFAAYEAVNAKLAA